ncbi:PAS domain-containing protein [Rhodoblastus sp.]|uniref:PAS domain-containing protein n=1 Tax=Rhodoblastus sp. TaxID=1962975 RepID=UPI003F9A42FB
MRQAATLELYSYWNCLRGARLSPERTEIDPAAIRHVLADTMILEVDEERRFPVRISGTRLNALFLDEQKGNSFTALFAPEERRSVSRMILAVLDESRPVVAGLTAAPKDARPANLELLILPLRHRGKTHSRVLGAITPTAIPSWLGLRPAACLRMVAMRFIDGGDPGPLPPMLRGALPRSPGDLAQRAKIRRRSFFVVAGGRTK